MELKEYQAGVLDAFARWLEALGAAPVESNRAVEALRGVGAEFPGVRNYPETAWRQLAKAGGVAKGVGARPCWPPPPWNGSTAKPA